jgi:hypothetical protein
LKQNPVHIIITLMDNKNKEQPKKDEPQVTVMGENINYNKDSGSSGDVVWGVFILLVGILLLFNFMEIVPWDVWQYLWRFFPVFLILAGLHIILGNNPISRFIMFVFALLLFGFIISAGLKHVNSPLVERFPPEVLNLIESWEEVQR